MDNIPSKYLSPYKQQGLNGRLLNLPSKDPKVKKHILLVYGIHTSHERLFSTTQFLSRYGDVTSVDLPGFGGMDSFYRIGKKATLENYADYLHQFLKEQDINKKHPITVVGMSFGCLIVIKMLSKYPDSHKWLDQMVSFVGFSSYKQLKFKSWQRLVANGIFRLCSIGIISKLISWLIFNRISLRLMFLSFRLVNPKYKMQMLDDPEAATNMELELWTKNDARTKFYTYTIIGSVDLHVDKSIGVPLHNITTPNDQYFDTAKVDQAFGEMFREYTHSAANMIIHAPSIISSEEEVAKIFSEESKTLLSS